MKILFLLFFFVFLLSFNVQAAGIPVYSANGFTCGRMGLTVTCKGPLPGAQAKDTVTATGHSLVYVTVDTIDAGQPLRYTYFSDTGCLVGYSFGADSKAVGVVARHRNGSKANFLVQNDNYDPVITYCEQNLEGSPAPVTGYDSPGVKSKAEAPTVAPTAVPATVAPAKTSTTNAKPTTKAPAKTSSATTPKKTTK